MQTDVSPSSLQATCPICGDIAEPYEVTVRGFDDVFCRYECGGDRECERCNGGGVVSEGDETEEHECPECGGSGTVPCSTHYAADGEHSSWED